MTGEVDIYTIEVFAFFFFGGGGGGGVTLTYMVFNSFVFTQIKEIKSRREIESLYFEWSGENPISKRRRKKNGKVKGHFGIVS